MTCLLNRIEKAAYLRKLSRKSSVWDVTYSASSGSAFSHVNTGEHLAARTLGLNEIGFCNIAVGLAAAFDPYEVNRRTGSFIVIDRYTNRTVGAGMIVFPLRRATNIAWQPLSVGKEQRAALKHQKPCIIWFTGLSGAGKSSGIDAPYEAPSAPEVHLKTLDQQPDQLADTVVNTLIRLGIVVLKSGAARPHDGSSLAPSV
jgi:hypothetical protein